MNNGRVQGFKKCTDETQETSPMRYKERKRKKKNGNKIESGTRVGASKGAS
jgi:hypothetical protein